LPRLAVSVIMITRWMSTRDNMKTRKPRPKTTGELIGVRVQPNLLEKLDGWRRIQGDLPGRAEAIRRLVELGLLAKDGGDKPAREPGSRAKHAAKAAGMAGQEIDRRGDPAVPVEEQARRKRRLIKGPSEFREMRAERRAASARKKQSKPG
jgi:hypothetical protein